MVARIVASRWDNLLGFDPKGRTERGISIKPFVTTYLLTFA
jgi:hypothetical protein